MTATPVATAVTRPLVASTRATPVALLDHVTSLETSPTTSTRTVRSCVSFGKRVRVAGATSKVVISATVTVQEAFFVLSKLLVAVIIASPPITAVTSPVVASTLAICGLLLVHVTSFPTLSPNASTSAVSFCFFPAKRVISAGCTETFFTPRTVMSHLPYLFALKLLIARIIVLPGAIPHTSPVVSSTCAISGAALDHVTPVSFPSLVITSRANFCFFPASKTRVEGWM